MLAFRSVVSVLLRKLGDFLYILKAGPAGGLRPGNDTTVTGALASPSAPGPAMRTNQGVEGRDEARP